MRKFWLTAMLVVLATTAYAVDLDNGNYVAKIQDGSVLYTEEGTPIGLLPAVFNDQTGLYDPDPAALALGNTQRTIFRVTTILEDGVNAVFDTSSSTELTGILADLVLYKATFVTPTQVVLDFKPITPVQDTLNGGIVRVYEDAAKNFNPDPGGAGLMANAIPAGGIASVAIPANGMANQWGAGYTFPTVTDGTLWLDGNLVDLAYLASVGVGLPNLPGAVPVDAGVVMREYLDFAAGEGSGFAFGDITGGSNFDNFTQGYITDINGDPTLADLKLGFHIYFPILNVTNGLWYDNSGYFFGPGFCTVDSQDPATFGITVPEPTTLAFLGIGLLGFALRRRVK